MAQNNTQFLSYQQLDGLSNNYIKTLFQDHAGFMWIGTENGLNRFDGHHFVTYRFDPDDSTSISNNWILSIHEDRSHNLWVGTQRGLNRLDRMTGSFERVLVNESGKKNQTFEISGIFEDKSGDLWAIANSHTLLRIHRQTGGGYIVIREQQITSHTKESTNINSILQDHLGNFWFRTSDGLGRWSPSAQTLEHFHFPFETGFLESGMTEGRMVVDPSGNIILFGNESGIFILSPSEKAPKIRPLEEFQQILKIRPELNKERLFYMTISPINQLWVVYRNKVLEIDLNKDSLAPNNLKEFSFPFDIHVLSLNQEGALWVGMAGGGVSIEKLDQSPFSFFGHNQEDPTSLSPGVVRAFAETKAGTLWVGLLGNGIDLLGKDESQSIKKKANLRHIPSHEASLSGDLIIEMHQGSQDRLWIATNASGLDEYNMESGLWTHYRHDPSNPNSISQNRIWGVTEDSEGWVWVGTFQEGLNHLNPKTGTIERFRHDPKDYSSLLDNQIKSLYTDSQGEVWIGSHAGLSRFNKQEERFYHYVHDPNNPSSISNGIVWCIYEDQQGGLWVGTGLGLNYFDRKTNTFEHFFEKDGLPSNTIYGLLQDNEQNLWVSTDAGLALLLDTNTENNFRAIKQKDGLASTSFVPKAFFKSSINGWLYFGSTAGIVIVDPLLLSKEQTIPNIRLHSFSRNNLRSKEGGQITDYFIEQKSKDITLTHLDQSVSIAFTDLRWEKNKPYTYSYQLVGLNKRWMPLVEDMEVTFTNLDPGNYTLKLRAIDRYGQMQQEKSMLTFQVYPPWWRSGWAYGFYVILILLVLWGFYRLQLRRQLEKQEAASLRRLDSFKNRLYANITHEFRTPLTIILGMIEQVEKNPKKWLNEGANMIRKNGSNLLDLINQMLDLQKLKSGTLQPILQYGDIVPFLENIVTQFQTLANSKDQQLDFFPNEQSLLMDFDQQKLYRIVSNLLTNAIKYTPERGQVCLKLSKWPADDESATSHVQLQVSDTGAGIPEKELPFIFDRFYRAQNELQALEIGTGIGLSLTYELVKVLNGTIAVSSEIGKGTSFYIKFPITEGAQAMTSLERLNVQKRSSKTENLPLQNQALSSELPLALVVEDNAEIAQYLQICLDSKYQVTIAENGKLGIEIALETIPDIIISDVMMPEKDGFELCETLKEDPRTSHIPIILLTAKANVESRIIGLKHGADDYLAKPFHEEELLVRMQNLLQIRRKLQLRYQDLYNEPIVTSISSKPDKEDAFIQDLKEIFDERMTDLEFDLDALSEALHLSRSQLGRKVKAVTGHSPAIFVRSLRLQKARHLLLTSGLSVKEVAYDVGFSDPSYFSRAYSEQFGESPTSSREIGPMRK